MRPPYPEAPVHTPSPHAPACSPVRSSLWAAVLLVATGCRGCEGGSGADFAKKEAAPETEAPAAAKRAKAKRGGAPNTEGRMALRALRNLKMRVPNAAEVDRLIDETVAKARGMVAKEDRQLALEARSLLDTWLATHPEDADAHYWKGRAELIAEEPRASVTTFQQANTHAPDFVAPWRWGAWALHSVQQCDDAMPLLARAVQLEPSNPDVFVDRVVCAVKLQRWEVVVEDLEVLCTMDEAELCAAKPAAQEIADRQKARQAGGKQVRKALQKSEDKLGKAGKSGGPLSRLPGGGSVRDMIRAKAKAKAKAAAEAAEADGTPE